MNIVIPNRIDSMSEEENLGYLDCIFLDSDNMITEVATDNYGIFIVI